MIPLSNSVTNIAIVGCGGGASYLVNPLCKLLNGCSHKPPLFLMDGDTIEPRNLDRQLFSAADIGSNKADALAAKCSYVGGVTSIPQYLTPGSLAMTGNTLILGCADNHAARRAMLEAVDRGMGWAIIAGNEYTEAEAYYYEQEWKDSPCDPRKYYPSILTDNSGDPTRPEGCTGEAAERSPQLVLANFSAVNAMLWLLYHHFVERDQDPNYNPDYAPVKIWNYGTKFVTTRKCDL